MNLNKTILIAATVLLAAASYHKLNANQLEQSPIPTRVIQIFEAWRIKHNKMYASPHEKIFRMGVFFKNYLKVKMHKNPSYTVALNRFSDMLLKEVKAKHFGYRRMSDSTAPVAQIELSQAPTPTSWDWRTKGAVTPVKDQGNCGSCWAFSTTGSVEGANQLATGTLTAFSEQYLVDCAKNGNYGCDGGEMTNALTWVKKHGIPTEAAYPYTARDGRCKKKVKTQKVISGWKSVQKHSAAALQAAVLTNPISIGIQADQILSYNSGIFNNPACKTQLDHGVLLVGYGVQGNKKYWLVKNSWSTSWGEQGYIRFERDDNKKINVCGILIEGEFPHA